VAGAARVTAPTIYKYFGSKQGLLFAVAHRGLDEIGRRLDAVSVASAPDLVSRIVNYEVAVLEISLNVLHARIWVAMESQYMAHPETIPGEAQKIDDFFIARNATFFASLRESGFSLPANRLEVLAEVVDAVAAGIFRSCMISGSYEREKVRGEFDRLFELLIAA